MEDVRIILSGLWVATMLTYLLGDVLRIFSGDAAKQKMGEQKMAEFTPGMWLGIAAIMVIPIVMVVVSLTVPFDVSRGTNIIAGIFFFLFVLAGLRTYPSAYDRFLLLVSMGFNVLTVWYAWNWV